MMVIIFKYQNEDEHADKDLDEGEDGDLDVSVWKTDLPWTTPALIGY